MNFEQRRRLVLALCLSVIIISGLVVLALYLLVIGSLLVLLVK